MGLLEEKGLIGVMHYALWNHWRMSPIHACALWHNVATILFEAAGASLATPINQTAKDLSPPDSGGLGIEGNTQRFDETQTSQAGLYQPWTADIDEGQTRWIFDTWEFPYTTIHNQDIRKGHLKEKYDVIILTSLTLQRIMDGQKESRTCLATAFRR